MIDARAVSDLVGSTVASAAQFCAREVLKRCQQVRQSRTVGEFVVNSGIAEVRRRITPSKEARPMSSSPAASAPDVAPKADEARPMPVDDYDLLTSAQVVELLETVGLDVVRAVLDYEMSHRRRRLVVEASHRLLDA